MAAARTDAARPRPWDALLAACARLPFVPHDIAEQLDAGGRYEMPLDDEFPFAISLFHYRTDLHTRGSTWHERLELFVPVEGRTLFRMGESEFDLGPGDLLVVDNLKLHHVVDFDGFDSRAVVVSFRPEFVYSLGSPSHDYTFLLPFYSAAARRARVLPLPEHPEAADALRRLVLCRFEEPDGALQRAGCKAFLLQLLLELARRFRVSELAHWEFLRQQQRTLRLKPLFDHVREHYADKLSVADAAAPGPDERAAVHEDVQEGGRHDAGRLPEPRPAGQRLAAAARDQPQRRRDRQRRRLRRSELFRQALQARLRADADGVPRRRPGRNRRNFRHDPS